MAAHILVVAPTRWELGGRRVKTESAILATVGIGMAAGPALTTLIKRHRPELILSVGVAGGLAPELVPGSLVVCSAANSASQDPWLVDIAEAALDAGWFDVCSGGFRTVAEPVTTRAEKRRLNEEGDVAVDMETSALAAAATSGQVPHCAVRAVLDGPFDALPASVNTVLDDPPRKALARTAGVALRQPRELVAYGRLARRSFTARRALTYAIPVLIDAFAGADQSRARRESSG